MYIDFFWNSSLSEDRRNQIKEWVESLNKEQQEMLEDYLSDHRDSIRFDTNEEIDSRQD